MSNDLISRSALSKKICNKECNVPEFRTDDELNAFLLGLNAKQIAVMECLFDMSTAYDVDEVVKRLMCESINCHIMTDRAIEIAKSGSIECSNYLKNENRQQEPANH